MRNKIIEVFKKYSKTVDTEYNVYNCLIEEDWSNISHELLVEFDKETLYKSIATEYAEFCVICDRKGIPLISLDDYIKNFLH
jgi:hypothetical protein